MRFEAGGTSDLDVQQATTLLEDTEADIPQLDIQLRQAQNSLSVLLGMPPSDLARHARRLAGDSGRRRRRCRSAFPAELLRRRPDVRRAERQLGRAERPHRRRQGRSLPRFSAGRLDRHQPPTGGAKFFTATLLRAVGGPQVDWPILNYGRIMQRRARAGRDLPGAGGALREHGAARPAGGRERDRRLPARRPRRGAPSGAQRRRRQPRRRAVAHPVPRAAPPTTCACSPPSRRWSRAGPPDRRRAARSRSSVIALYKALGGGWEIRRGKQLVPDSTKQEMASRTSWDNLLSNQAQSADLEAAASGTEKDHGWWRWRWWRPQW